jgi:hypothetical protein
VALLLLLLLVVLLQGRAMMQQADGCGRHLAMEASGGQVGGDGAVVKLDST